MERASAAFRQQGVQFPKQEVLTGSSPNMLTKPDLVNLGVVSRDTAQGKSTPLPSEHYRPFIQSAPGSAIEFAQDIGLELKVAFCRSAATSDTEFARVAGMGQSDPERVKEFKAGFTSVWGQYGNHVLTQSAA